MQAGKAYRFRVTARNAEGYSDFSEEIEIYAAVLPDAPLNFANDVDWTDANQITLTWTDGVSDGGSPILDYRINYDQGNGNWVVLDASVTTQTYLITSLTTDGVYLFTIEARNVLGYSPETAQISVR